MLTFLHLVFQFRLLIRPSYELSVVQLFWGIKNLFLTSLLLSCLIRLPACSKRDYLYPIAVIKCNLCIHLQPLIYLTRCCVCLQQVYAVTNLWTTLFVYMCKHIRLVTLGSVMGHKECPCNDWVYIMLLLIFWSVSRSTGWNSISIMYDSWAHFHQVLDILILYAFWWWCQYVWFQ